MRERRWVRKWSRDAGTDGFSPLPTQVVSNEEYIPLAQTVEQKRVAGLIDGTARRNSRRLGVSRRDFLASSAGMASAFLALNTVFGPFFEIDPVEAIESAAADERKPSDQFVFDIQTHHVAAPRQFPYLLGLRRVGRAWNPELIKDRGVMDELYLGNYIKEIFLDSDTTVAVISGIPSATDANNILPPDKMAETRDVINRLAASQRLVAHGLVSPNKGPSDLDEMRRQAADLKISAWKGYTGLPFGDPPKPWRVDDEKVAYPMLERARKLGIKRVCLHKGLPLGPVSDYNHPRDVIKAARDFPDIDFVLYHAGLLTVPRTQSADVPWTTEFCRMKKKQLGLRNIYMELGSTFGQLATTNPTACAHLMGQIVDAFGADHVLWGTDSIWYGTPQWQIEAFRRFEIPQALVDAHGYQPLNRLVKEQIFGLNAARLFGVDVRAKRNEVPKDYLSQIKMAYLDEGPAPSHRFYGWVAG